MQNNLAAPRILHVAFAAKCEKRTNHTLLPAHPAKHACLLTKNFGDFITQCNSEMERITQKVEEKGRLIGILLNGRKAFNTITYSAAESYKP